jgi:tetratricopeptide (TPR) repeat protein
MDLNHAMSRRLSPRAPLKDIPLPRERNMGEKSLRLPRWLLAGAPTVVVALVGAMLLGHRGPTTDDLIRLRAKAEASAQAGEWATALVLWQQVNANGGATGLTYLGEGKASLALGRAAQAERAFRKAVSAAPHELEPWLLLLEILRVEERQVDAMELGRRALEKVPPEGRLELLRELTLTALTDLPDVVARTTLKRWVDADPTDIDAQSALLRRIGTEPHSNDPDRELRISQLMEVLDRHPEHIGTREALVIALADAGEGDQGRVVLESWPAEARDGRFWRLQARWNLDYDHRPDEAVKSLNRALVDFPQDWRIHYRMARALRILHRHEEAHHEAERVARIRELLDPLTLEPLLNTAFARLPDQTAMETVAGLCERAGLAHLAEAWRATATRSAQHQQKAQDAIFRRSVHGTGNALSQR